MRRERTNVRHTSVRTDTELRPRPDAVLAVGSEHLGLRSGLRPS